METTKEEESQINTHIEESEEEDQDDHVFNEKL